MEVIEGLENIKGFKKTVVTSGTFDGVHKAHQKILSYLVSTAQAINGTSVLLTYWPHPRFVVDSASQDLKLITTLEEKIALLSSTGIDYLVVIPFTKAFSKMTSEAFVKDILIDKIGTAKLVIGYNHKFGRNREGSFEYLNENAKQLGFEVEEIPQFDIDNTSISSTKIRKALHEGDIATANTYLGRPFGLSGTVVQGDKIGRQIGFPTANISLPDPQKIVPGDGIYAVKAFVQQNWHEGMLYIGKRPTIQGAEKLVIEVHLFNFEANIYGEKITVDFYKRLRHDAKFDSLEALKDQLNIQYI